MRGITQREYDAWRKKQGKRPRPVRQSRKASSGRSIETNIGMRWIATVFRLVLTFAFSTPA